MSTESTGIQSPYVVAKNLGYPRSVLNALKNLDENDPKATRILYNARHGIYPDSVVTKSRAVVKANHSKMFI